MLNLSWVDEGAGTLEAGGTLGPEDVFSYIYGLLHSHEYRRRFADPLKSHYAHVLVPGSLSLLTQLVGTGGRLLSIHVGDGEAPEPSDVTFEGPKDPIVGRVGWSEDTVWIDAVKGRRGASKADVAGTVGFRGVREEVWNFHIGGYQVCEKWLKDRRPKKGQPRRTLTASEIRDYRYLVVALQETIRLMDEIDGAIHATGGWPGAFQPR